MRQQKTKRPSNETALRHPPSTSVIYRSSTSNAAPSPDPHQHFPRTKVKDEVSSSNWPNIRTETCSSHNEVHKGASETPTPTPPNPAKEKQADGITQQIELSVKERTLVNYMHRFIYKTQLRSLSHGEHDYQVAPDPAVRKYLKQYSLRQGILSDIQEGTPREQGSSAWRHVPCMVEAFNCLGGHMRFRNKNHLSMHEMNDFATVPMVLMIPTTVMTPPIPLPTPTPVTAAEEVILFARAAAAVAGEGGKPKSIHRCPRGSARPVPAEGSLGPGEDPERTGLPRRPFPAPSASTPSSCPFGGRCHSSPTHSLTPTTPPGYSATVLSPPPPPPPPPQQHVLTKLAGP
ncbi:uncharacterized protein LOC125044485 [Penaeus chinensis]|uniref:uncharacterized protein LOC125044485 n=1 Tax=Penaeus chinensis TaxID=139456 RepID=UPI001FB5ADA9|nr:uncharacterized protein LOC125044485 [Penaeus chinensis]